MRTLLIILGGLLLLAVGLLLDRWLWAGTHMVRIAQVFVAVWLALALLNMWAGVSRAGYSVAEEFPIFLVIFLIPAAVAVFIAWKFS
jgi:hypothetical protein